METLPHPDLQLIKTRLLEIQDAISTFKPLTARPPILDSSFDAANENSEENQWLQQEGVPGLKKLRENIKIDLGVLEKFLDDPGCANLPPLSTNAPYLVAVWNELICASAPIVSVFKTFPVNASVVTPAEKARARSAQQPPPGTKVDIVADNGRRWIRVNTVKNSRMLSEFREIDSYLTDSDEESDEGWDDLQRPSLAQAEFDNSILKMGRSLLKAAHANLIEGTSEIPRVIIRLTRLDPNLPSDDGTPPDRRIAQTLDSLREMGVEVELGERTDAEIAQFPDPSSEEASSSNQPYVPTPNINLDLSVLIALISDLTHASLPQSIEDANKRFVPPQEYRDWKQKRQVLIGKSKPHVDPEPPTLESLALETDINDLPRDLIKHARALTNQLLQEMGKGLMQEVYNRITSSALQDDESSGIKNVIFWTTSEARDRCLRIVSKIGGIHEKRRARALFCLAPDDTSEIPLEEAECLYWQDSRFPPKFIPFLPIRIFPSASPDPSTLASLTLLDMPHCSKSSFGMSLSKVCSDILLQETMPHPRSLSDDGAKEHLQRATVTKANPRLTAHTVLSMQWGAELGWTTLTANRTSVKAILRELKAARVAGRLAGVGTNNDRQTEKGHFASIWIVDPRSLAEGMSSLPPAKSQ